MNISQTKRALVVFGTRPEAIKMAPVVKKLEEYHEFFEMRVCVTAQHREMLDQVLEIFRIHPHYDLNVMKPNQDLYKLTSSVILGLGEVLSDFRPDIVLVHGDTTTSFCAALSAFYQQIPVAHVEAGLRTGNIYSPWPEEMNRKLTGAITTVHFTPTEMAKKNLEREGVTDHVYITGNTVIDALLMAVEMIHSDAALSDRLARLISERGYPIHEGRKIILVTGHRRENFGEGFIHICEAIRNLAIKYPDFDLVYPVHFNPNVRKPVYELLGGISNIYLIEPIEYLPFIYMMERSYLLLTDSGGIQEEAPSLGKPVIVMRNTTERPEAVDAGTVILAGTNRDVIIHEVSKLIDDQDHYHTMSKAHNPYGDGYAAQRIVDNLKEFFWKSEV
jgi:UDP-N-acetylglucosamine 2-epimerase (non-hydrolysing)